MPLLLYSPLMHRAKLMIGASLLIVRVGTEMFVDYANFHSWVFAPLILFDVFSVFATLLMMVGRFSVAASVVLLAVAGCVQALAIDNALLHTGQPAHGEDGGPLLVIFCDLLFVVVVVSAFILRFIGGVWLRWYTAHTGKNQEG